MNKMVTMSNVTKIKQKEKEANKCGTTSSLVICAYGLRDKQAVIKRKHQAWTTLQECGSKGKRQGDRDKLAQSQGKFFLPRMKEKQVCLEWVDKGQLRENIKNTPARRGSTEGNSREDCS